MGTKNNTDDAGVLTRLHRWLIDRSVEGRGCENGACEYDPERGRSGR
ncbi:hypothetical protein [Halorubrum luteum]